MKRRYFGPIAREFRGWLVRPCTVTLAWCAAAMLASTGAAPDVKAVDDAKQKQEESAEALVPALGPYVQFVLQGTAEVFWETDLPCGSIVEYGESEVLGQRVEDTAPKRVHRLKLTGLQPETVYHYRVGASDRVPDDASDRVSDKVSEGAAVRNGEIHCFDTALNYGLPAFPDRAGPYPEDVGHPSYAAIAGRILKRTGVTKGYCLVLGCEDGRLAYELAQRSDLRITCVDTDRQRLSRAAAYFKKAGIYGSRASVRRVDSLATLPFTKYFTNLIVSERMIASGECPGSAAEMFRVLRPSGGVAYLGRPGDRQRRPERAELEQWFKAGGVDCAIDDSDSDDGGLWAKVVRGPLPGGGGWTHQYGDPDNAADSRDDLEGATETGQLQVQWLGRPGADFGADRNPRMPAPLTAAGRLFHQGLDRIVALDAYNGTILWGLEIPGLLRVNMPRDSGPWCADDACLYVAVKDRCWRLDAYTGNRVDAYRLPRSGAERLDTAGDASRAAGREYDWGYVGRQADRLYGSGVQRGGRYTDIWGGSGQGWYDGTSGSGTAKVCSDYIFALKKDTGEEVWTYRHGVIINATITIGAGRVYFVECRHPKVTGHTSGRIGLAELWNDQYLVALDAASGTRLWEEAVDTPDGIVVFFLSYGGERLFIASSAAGKYHLDAFDATDGTPLWKANHNWTSDNHSGHMQHAVVTADVVYLEPCGYRAEDGKRVTAGMGRHEGCATYVGTDGALIYRGRGRQIAMWDMKAGKTTVWDALRPSCWISTIAGGGMVLSPEGGGGCSCAHWLQTSLGFVSKKPATAAHDENEHESK